MASALQTASNEQQSRPQMLQRSYSQQAMSQAQPPQQQQQQFEPTTTGYNGGPVSAATSTSMFPNSSTSGPPHLNLSLSSPPNSFADLTGGGGGHQHHPGMGRRFSVDSAPRPPFNNQSHFSSHARHDSFDDDDPFRDFSEDNYGGALDDSPAADSHTYDRRDSIISTASSLGNISSHSTESSSSPHHSSNTNSHNNHQGRGGSPNSTNDNSGPPKKRSRATPEQLAILEDTFATNTSPNAKLREILAGKVNMTERSIQIWFQNRRAKVKLIHKRAAQQAAKEHVMRTQSMWAAAYGMRPGFYPAPYGMPYSPYAPKHVGRSSSVDLSALGGMGGMGMGMGMGGMGMGPMGGPMGGMPRGMMPSPGMLGMPEDTGLPGPVSGEKVASFTADSLAVGTWRRVPITTNDLVCSFNLMDRTMRWQIVEGASKFKMELPFACISSIVFEQLDAFTGQITFELSQVPMFFMEVMMGGACVWTQCRDFTEETQATRVLQHIIKGQAESLKGELLYLGQQDNLLQSIMHFLGNGNPSVNMSGMTSGGAPFAPMMMPGSNEQMISMSPSPSAPGGAMLQHPMYPAQRRHSTPNLLIAQMEQTSLHDSLMRRPINGLAAHLSPHGSASPETMDLSLHTSGLSNPPASASTTFIPPQRQHHQRRPSMLSQSASSPEHQDAAQQQFTQSVEQQLSTTDEGFDSAPSDLSALAQPHTQQQQQQPDYSSLYSFQNTNNGSIPHPSQQQPDLGGGPNPPQSDQQVFNDTLLQAPHLLHPGVVV